MGAKFIKNSSYQTGDDLYKKIEENIKGLMNCFDEKVIEAFGNDHYNDPEASMENE